MKLNERIEELLASGPGTAESARHFAVISRLVHPLFAERARQACTAYLDSMALARPAPNIHEEFKATGITTAQVHALIRLSPEAKRYANVTPDVIRAVTRVAAMGTAGLWCTKGRGGRPANPSARRLILELDKIWTEANGENRRGWPAFVKTCAKPLIRFGFPETPEAIEKLLTAARTPKQP
jgi:hypothetical protein